MKTKLIPYILIFVIWIIFSSPYFFKGLSPFPSNYQVNNFSPWSSYKELAGPIKNAAQPDLITQIYPWKNLVINQWKRGEIPLWNQFSFAGTPLLANFQSAAFSPFNFLFFLPLKFIDSWSVLVLLQPLLAGIFTYIFMRSLKASASAGLVSSLSFMFCGFITTWMSYATLGYAVLFIPLGLYAIEKFFITQKTRFQILLTLTIAFSLFSGHFQASLYTLIIIFFYALYKGLIMKKRKKAFVMMLYIIFGVLLAMPQLLPTVELYTRSVRSEIFRAGEIIPWKYIVTLFAPDFFGNPVTRNDWFGHYAEWNGYTGVIAIILASVFIFVKKSITSTFFIISALISLLLAFDTPFISLLVALKIPVLSTSAASRMIVIFSFSVAILAGLGLDKLLEIIHKDARKIYIWLLTILIIFLTIIGYVYFNGILPEKAVISRNNLFLPVVILILFFGIVIAATKIGNKKFINAFIVLIILIISFDMLRFAAKWQSFDPKSKAFMDVGVSEFYKKQNGIDRALGLAGGEDGVYYGFPVLTGYDPLYDETYGKLIGYIASSQFIKPERSVVNFAYNGEHTSKAINFLGVKYIIHKVSDGTFSWAFPFKNYPIDQFKKVFDDGKFQIFENNKVLKRAFVVSDYKVLKKDKDILIQMFDDKTDLSRTVFLNTNPKIAKVEKDIRAKVDFVDYSSGSIVIDVDTNSSGILVLSDVYYPGWKVSVNNKKEKLLKTDYVFRGVVIPKGRSIVKFNYVPDSFLIGTYLSLIGILGIIIDLVLKSMSKNK